MAEVQTQIEQEDHDDTADKAAEIGKMLGVDDAGLKKFLDVDDKGEEKALDYEIVEDEEKSDERIAKEREKAPKVDKSERKQLSNKEKRELRKKRLQEKFQAKDEIIQQQQEEIESFKKWKGEIEGRLTNVDKGKVEDALVQTQAIMNKAFQDQAAAINEGRGEDATAAQRIAYDAAQRLQQLQAWKQQLDRVPNQPQTSTADSSVVVRKRQAWEEKHDWYNPTGNDEDSMLAKTISGILVSEGFSPKTDDFWDELDDRLAARGIGSQAEEDLEEEEAPKPRKRQAPPVGGGSNRNNDVGGKNRVNLPPALVQTLKDNGIWDDTERRNRVVRNYLQEQKQSQG